MTIKSGTKKSCSLKPTNLFSQQLKQNSAKSFSVLGKQKRFTFPHLDHAISTNNMNQHIRQVHVYSVIVSAQVSRPSSSIGFTQTSSIAFVLFIKPVPQGQS